MRSRHQRVLAIALSALALEIVGAWYVIFRPDPWAWSGVVIVVVPFQRPDFTEGQRELLRTFGECRFETVQEAHWPSTPELRIYFGLRVIRGDEVLAFRGLRKHRRPWSWLTDRPDVYRVPGRWPVLRSGELPPRGERAAVVGRRAGTGSLREVTIDTCQMQNRESYTITGTSYERLQDTGPGEILVREEPPGCGGAREVAGLIVRDPAAALAVRAALDAERGAVYDNRGCVIAHAFVVGQGVFETDLASARHRLRIAGRRTIHRSADGEVSRILEVSVDPVTPRSVDFLQLSGTEPELVVGDLAFTIDGRVVTPRVLSKGEPPGGPQCFGCPFRVELDVPDDPYAHQLDIRIDGKLEATTLF